MLVLWTVQPVYARDQESGAKTERPRVVLALGGGGTRGLAHIGVLRVLEQEGIPIDGIAGTSMGAIVGGLYAAGVPLDEIEKVMRNKTLLRSYDTVPIPVRLAVMPLFALPHVIGYHPLDGLYRGNRFAKFINRLVPATSRNIEQFRIPFGAVSCDLLTGKSHVLNEGNIGRAIQASSAIPLLRRPVPWQDKLLVDGGISNNLPVAEARAMGGDIVIAVDVNEVQPLSERDFHRIGSVTWRCIGIHLSTIDRRQLKNAQVVIQPEVGNISLLSRRLRDLDLAIEKGAESARRALPAIKELLARPTVEFTCEGSKRDRI